MTFSQNNIGTSPVSVPGNIYHMGGNLGVGTKTPEQLLEISNESIVSLRLKKTNPASACGYTFWDITNNGKLLFQRKVFSCANPTDIETIMTLSPYGNISIGTENANNSALLHIESSEMGVLIPRMTTLQIQNISAPANGLLVFDLDAQKFSYYDNNAGLWQILPTENDLSNYLSISEFETYPASNITSDDISNWDLAYIWGSHAEQGYITASSSDNFTNKSGDISMWINNVGYLTEADIESSWTHQENTTFLVNIDDFVGIGTSEPYKKLHIFSSTTNGVIKSTLRLQTDATGVHKHFYSVWDIENDNDLKFNYASAETEPNPTTENLITFKRNGKIEAQGFLVDGVDISKIWTPEGDNIFYEGGNVGIGTNLPDATLEIIGGNGTANGIHIQAGLFSLQTALMKLESAEGISAMYVSSHGEIGFGTDMPQSHLEVRNGSIAITGSQSLGQGPRFQINTGASINHTFVELKNDRGVLFEILGNGLVKARELWLDAENWEDEVFFPEYELMTIDSLEQFVKTNHHLPEIPSEEEIIENGVSVLEMQTLQMKKIEQLTLYIIELNKRIEALEKENEKLKEMNN